MGGGLEEVCVGRGECGTACVLSVPGFVLCGTCGSVGAVLCTGPNGRGSTRGGSCIAAGVCAPAGTLGQSLRLCALCIWVAQLLQHSSWDMRVISLSDGGPGRDGICIPCY